MTYSHWVVVLTGVNYWGRPGTMARFSPPENRWYQELFLVPNDDGPAPRFVSEVYPAGVMDGVKFRNGTAFYTWGDHDVL